MMAKIIIYLFFIMTCCSCSIQDQPSHKKLIDEKTDSVYIKTNYVSDLVLLYHGGTHRLDYTEEELKPYVYRETKGKVEWLFDGFLFIEFKDNLGHEFAKGYHQKPANKIHWEWLLKRNFEKGKGISALNALLTRLSKRGDVPKRMRKVVLTLPDPIIGFKEWGQMKGKDLDFNNVSDRVEACKWFVDHTISEWEKQKFKELDFEGFYWVAETQSTTKDVLPQIAEYIKSKGYKFYWIPYMYAEGAREWKTAGFDIAYQQPNYFFGLDKPKSLFDKAIYNADNFGMGVEMEFDKSMITNEAFRQRYYDYIAAFEQGGVWKSKPVAYYEGGGAWLDLFRSDENSPARKDYDYLSEIIIKRQLREDSKF